MTDTVLVLAWLVFAHLVADFVLQNDWIALNKGTGGRGGWAALGVHGFHVALCLAPTVLAFGLPALLYLVVVVVSHMAVDRWKVQATRRAERSALEGAQRRFALGSAPASGLGSAWTPWPGMLFLADQALHLLIAVLGWLIILEGVPLQGWFTDLVDTALRGWDRALVHAVVLTGVVLVSLFLANTRGAYYFVLALVSPRELPDTTPLDPEPEPGAAAATTARSGYTVRVGPLVATVEPGVAAVAVEEGPNGATAPAPAPAEDAEPRPKPAVPSGAPARIGATIGALERLLIVVIVLVNAEVAVGFVIAAKTIARFKQLDDRGFAEYYLLGTLASVTVAFVTAIVGRAALGTIP
jgi:hypothetical protein